jgi:glycosyltransferase involved in cell wall biosynthesis
MSQFTVQMDGAASPVPGNGEPSSRLTRSSSVLAIVPHYQCEPWLGDCLDSLVRQTRPPDGIVVIDDGSGAPPTDIVRQFPAVTLLTSSENVGPYRLSQTVIEQTGYDAYLFQDADDWSGPTRLELELAEAERTGAELIGCQGYRVLCEQGEVVPLIYPLDGNLALKKDPKRHVLLHPGSLVSRDLVLRIGGFSTAQKFGADTEFQHRAGHVSRVTSIPQFVYFRRDRVGSLTSSVDTGLASPLREELKRMEVNRAQISATLVAQGLQPNLGPLTVAGSIPLTHLEGPTLRSATGKTWPV